MATWPLKPSAGMLKLLCFSDSYFFILNKPLFHWLSLRRCVTMPRCHFHSFFEVFAFCSHCLKASGIPRLTSCRSGQWSSLCLPPCDRLDTHFHPTNQCRKVFAAPCLLPELIFLQHFFAFQSTLPSSFRAATPKPAPAKYPPSILLNHALLSTFSYRLFWPAAEAFSSHFLANMSHVKSSVAFEYQGVPEKPLDAQITGLAHHCSCRSTYLLPYLNFLEPVSSKLLFVRDTIFPSRLLLPSTELSGQGGKFFLYFEAICFHEQGQEVVPFLPAAAAICLLN